MGTYSGERGEENRRMSPREVYHPHSTAVKQATQTLETWEENVPTPDISSLSYSKEQEQNPLDSWARLLRTSL